MKHEVRMSQEDIQTLKDLFSRVSQGPLDTPFFPARGKIIKKPEIKERQKFLDRLKWIR